MIQPERRERLDLDAESRRALEYDELLGWVASLARTRMGAESLLRLEPLAELSEIQEEIEAVDEVRRFLEEQGDLLGSLPDPRQALRVLGIADLRLEGPALRELAVVARAASELRLSLLALPADRLPRLQRLGFELPDLARESRAVLGGLDGEGRILDDASPELRSIRLARARTGERLHTMLQRLLREPGSEPIIRDDYITQRSGRYVIPVRTDAPRQLQGIVHASSSSGATHFIEPLESVELNNELVRLAEQEQAEQERILLAWTEAFRVRRPDVEAMLEGVSRIDSLQARSLFGRDAGGVKPRVAQQAPLQLSAVRHPLLERRLQERGRHSVPLDLVLEPPDQALVLSGPNTGGKTVALKTLGLAALMAQSGIPVTAADASLPCYRQVRADIGDHQSIQADLSTYSAHIRAVVSFLAEARPPALLLFDEIGTGTDPAEGAALGQSILEALIVPGLTTVATTHLSALKAWAFGTAGACSAAMDFDPETLQPSYRIVMGSAGSSAGLEMAARLGLDPRIVQRAQQRLGGEAHELERCLTRLRQEIAALAQKREALEITEQELVAERRQLAEREAAEEQRRSQQAAQALEQALKAFREQARQELASVKDERERARVAEQLGRSERRMRQVQERQKRELAPQLQGRVDWEAPAALLPGMRVYVLSLERAGELVEQRGERVEVRFGSAVFNVPFSDLRVPPAQPKGTDPLPEPERFRARRVSSTPAPAAIEPELPAELLLLGWRVDEALEEIDRFLDGALLAGHEEVRIVHGHGTGRLRDAVRRFLGSHAHVRACRAGRPAEGGDGATVVTLG